MTKFEAAFVPEAERVLVFDDLVRKFEAGAPEVLALYPGINRQNFIAMIKPQIWRDSLVYKNDTYQVEVSRENRTFHLSIKRIDRQPCKDWRDFQRIKNELIGPEFEAVELYPAESRLVDGANQYHLWGLLDPKFRFPFGFNDGRQVSDLSIGKSVNRKVNT